MDNINIVYCLQYIVNKFLYKEITHENNLLQLFRYFYLQYGYLHIFKAYQSYLASSHSIIPIY